MNILFIHRVADYSEVSLLEWFCHQGHSVSIISDPREPRKEQFERAGAHVITLEVAHRLHLKSVVKIRQICKNKPIDIVYASFNAGISTASFATIGLPTKVIGYRGTLGNLSRWDPFSYLAHLNPLLSGVVCNCPPIKKFLLSLGLQEKNVRVIYKGHDGDWYKTTPPPPKSELSIPEKNLILGVVANIRPLKGVESLVDAVAPLFKEFPLTVLLVGSDKGGAIHQKVQAMGLNQQIRLLGFRKDAAQIAQYFDIATLPSTRREGVPRSIVEAMSHGKPSVVTDVGGLPYIVKHEESGLVVPPNNPEALREALKMLLKDKALREQYGKAAEERFHEMFALSTYHEEMERFFAVISKRGSRVQDNHQI